MGPEDCGRFVPVPGAIIAFHYVGQGRSILEVEREPVASLAAGDVVILPRNDCHLLGSGTGLTPAVADDLIRPGVDGGPATIHYGGGGEATRIICGFLRCERQYEPLLALLPALIKLTLPDPVAAGWFQSSFRLAARETVFSSRAPRQTWQNSPSCCSWRRCTALPTPRRQRTWIGPAVSPIRGSRSAFAARFAELVGVSPMRYLALQRLQQAARRLTETREPLGKIAFDIGYDSEAAFNRAFKKKYGLPPATWRTVRTPPPS